VVGETAKEKYPPVKELQTCEKAQKLYILAIEPALFYAEKDQLFAAVSPATESPPPIEAHILYSSLLI
jgi:hypothetical protein